MMVRVTGLGREVKMALEDMLVTMEVADQTVQRASRRDQFGGVREREERKK
jgi:hypothetical protein